MVRCSLMTVKVGGCSSTARVRLVAPRSAFLAMIVVGGWATWSCNFVCTGVDRCNAGDIVEVSSLILEFLAPSTGCMKRGSDFCDLSLEFADSCHQSLEYRDLLRHEMRHWRRGSGDRWIRRMSGDP